jgi:hypothetical protein
MNMSYQDAFDAVRSTEYDLRGQPQSVVLTATVVVINDEWRGNDNVLPIWTRVGMQYLQIQSQDRRFALIVDELYYLEGLRAMTDGCKINLVFIGMEDDCATCA